MTITGLIFLIGAVTFLYCIGQLIVTHHRKRKEKEKDHGPRRTAQAGNSGAPRHPVPGSGYTTPPTISLTSPRPGAVVSVTAGARTGMSPPLPIMPTVAVTTFGSLAAVGSGIGIGTFSSASLFGSSVAAARGTVTCQVCGDLYPVGQLPAHVCDPVSRFDLDVVATIQALTAQGLSPAEIAQDMRIVRAWRMWCTGEDGITAITMGTLWPLDRPLQAKCQGGCPPSVRRGCSAVARPPCLIHALKQRIQVSGAYGEVALWGEVIECTSGYLASRGYPLSLNSRLYAKAYGVAYLPEARDPVLYLR